MDLPVCSEESEQSPEFSRGLFDQSEAHRSHFDAQPILLRHAKQCSKNCSQLMPLTLRQALTVTLPLFFFRVCIQAAKARKFSRHT